MSSEELSMWHRCHATGFIHSKMCFSWSIMIINCIYFSQGCPLHDSRDTKLIKLHCKNLMVLSVTKQNTYWSFSLELQASTILCINWHFLNSWWTRARRSEKQLIWCKIKLSNCFNKGSPKWIRIIYSQRHTNYVKNYNDYLRKCLEMLTYNLGYLHYFCICLT